LLARGVVPLPV